VVGVVRRPDGATVVGDDPARAFVLGVVAPRSEVPSIVDPTEELPVPAPAPVGRPRRAANAPTAITAPPAIQIVAFRTKERPWSRRRGGVIVDESLGRAHEERSGRSRVR
jgi:hypothetical protein